MISRILFLLALVPVLAGCTDSDLVGPGPDADPEVGPDIEVLEGVELTTNLLGDFADCTAFWQAHTRAFVFYDGVLASQCSDISVASCGKITLGEDVQLGSRVYFAVAGPDAIDYGGVVAGATTFADFVAITSLSGQSSRLLTAVFAVFSGDADFHVDFVRSYSGVNFMVEDGGVELLHAEISGISGAFAPFAARNPAAEQSTLQHTFQGGGSRAFEAFCIYANSYQAAPQLSVVVRLADNTEHTYSTPLPLQIKNGLSYQLTIAQNAATLTPMEWNTESHEQVGPDYDDIIRIDPDFTDLPAGARLSATLDTIYMPYRGGSASFRLAVKSDVRLVSENAERVSIDSQGGDEVLQCDFTITSGCTNPVGGRESFRLNIHRLPLVEVYDEDFIIVTLLENPVVVDKNLQSLLAGEWEFKASNYIEDTISRFTLPVGYSLSVQGDWLRSSKNEQGETIIEAAYIPNDPNGDGRVDNGQIIITDPNGLNDTYAISRRNWSMPVVWINGRYWAKFNQRGDAESYADQVRVGSALDQVEDLYVYLKTATLEEYYAYAGDQYVSRSVSTPLTFSATEQRFVDYGAVPQAEHIATADKAMGCPEGYERPSQAEFLHILLNGADYGNVSTTADVISNFNTSTGGFRNRCTSFKRVGLSAGGATTSIFSTKIENIQSGTNYDPFLFSGFGTQGSADGAYDPETTIVAVSVPTGQWTMKAISTSKFNISQSSQAVGQSYTLRCIKKEVPFTIR